MERVRIAVVLPCLNERSSVKEVICDWLSVSKNLDVYFCDNGSTDGSLEEAMLISDPRLHILQEEKRGKGCAVRKVLKEVSADVYVLCDVAKIRFPGFGRSPGYLRRILFFRMDFPWKLQWQSMPERIVLKFCRFQSAISHAAEKKRPRFLFSGTDFRS